MEQARLPGMGDTLTAGVGGVDGGVGWAVLS